MYDEIVTFMQTGGAFMYPILAVLAFGLAIAIERYVYISAIKLNNRRLLSKLMPLLKEGDLNQVYSITSRSKVAICQMLTLGLSRFKIKPERDQIEMAMEESLMEIIPRLAKRTHYLAMFAYIATLTWSTGDNYRADKSLYCCSSGGPFVKGRNFIE